MMMQVSGRCHTCDCIWAKRVPWIQCNSEDWSPPSSIWFTHSPAQLQLQSFLQPFLKVILTLKNYPYHFCWCFKTILKWSFQKDNLPPPVHLGESITSSSNTRACASKKKNCSYAMLETDLPHEPSLYCLCDGNHSVDAQVPHCSACSGAVTLTHCFLGIRLLF